jgi:hypothetical protein
MNCGNSRHPRFAAAAVLAVAALVVAASAAAADRPPSKPGFSVAKPAATCGKQRKSCNATRNVMDVVLNEEEDLAPPPVIANPCNGEMVVLTGRWHILSAFTVSATGQFSTHTQTNYENVRGAAVATGTSYQANDTTYFSDHVSNGSDTFMERHDLELVSLGVLPNFIMHVLVKTTVGATGSHSVVDNVWSDCKGV